jgi:hypothetical protein
MNTDDVGLSSGLGALLGGGLGTLGGAALAARKLKPMMGPLGEIGASGRLLRALSAPGILKGANTGGIFGAAGGGLAGGLSTDTPGASGLGGGLGGGAGAAIGSALGIGSVLKGLPGSMDNPKSALLRLLLKPALGAAVGGGIGSAVDAGSLRYLDKVYSAAQGG